MAPTAEPPEETPELHSERSPQETPSQTKVSLGMLWRPWGQRWCWQLLGIKGRRAH